MIRCNKCGFSNQDFAERCVKCRAVLSEIESPVQNNALEINKRTIQVLNDDQKPWDQPVSSTYKRDFSDRKESEYPDRERKRTTEYPEDDNRRPDGYGLPEEEEIPVVAEIMKKEDDTSPVSGFPTERRFGPVHQHRNYLVAISPEGDKELRKIELVEKEVVLDRAVLDPSNTSISRNGHANMYYKNGSWYLENRTALKTTFVQVNQPVKLSDGDVILIGDSLFKFKQS